MVAAINRLASTLAVRANAPWRSLAELTAYLKQKGDKASYAASNPAAQVVGEIYKQEASAPPCRSSTRPASTPPTTCERRARLRDPRSGLALAQQREGRLRILATAAGQRMQGFPDMPTFAEQGVAMDMLGWWAAFVPAATPRPIIDKLNAWFNQVQALPETKTFHNTYGSDPWIMTPEEGQARLLQDIKNWADYVRIAKIEPQGYALSQRCHCPRKRATQYASCRYRR